MFAISPRFVDDFPILSRFPDDICPWELLSYPSGPTLNRHQALAASRGLDAETEVHNTDKEFRVRLNLQHFKPEEVKITSDSERVTICAKHEEQQDNHGFISREITRTYKLPENVDPKSITSVMNSQGTLSIKAQKLAIESPKETPIPIDFK